MSKPIDPQSAMEQIWKLAPAYAKAKSERVYLEEYRKSLKATLMKSSGVEAIGAQERESYSHPDYVKHLEAIRDAVEAEEAARWKLVAAQSAIEIWRTQEASNRGIDRAAR